MPPKVEPFGYFLFNESEEEAEARFHWWVRACLL